MKLNSTFFLSASLLLLVITERMESDCCIQGERQSLSINRADAGDAFQMINLKKGNDVGYDFGYCLEFDGRNDYVLLDSSINPKSNDWTVSYWVKPEIVSEQVHLGVDVIFTRFGFANATNYRMRIYSTNYDFKIPRTTMNEWHHVLISRASGRGRVFINGVESSTGEMRIPLSGWEWSRFGVSATNGFLYQGRMDDILMWIGTAASDSLAQKIYNDGIGADAIELIGIPTHGWKLDGTDSTRLVVDSFGQVDGSLIKFRKTGMWVEH